MRFSNSAKAAVLLSSTLLAPVYADDIEDAVGGDEAAAAAAAAAPSSASAAKPQFTALSSIKAPFFEQFTDDWNKRWRESHAKKEKDGKTDTKEEWSYVGKWAVEEPSTLKGIEGDKGLVVKDKAAHHAISAKFAKPIDNTDKDFVVQYEVKLQDGLECGGAYLKLLKENKELHREEFSNASPYIIMFGPDKCGATNKVHFIFRHKNPKTGEYEEKHLNSPPMARISKKSVLYTLIIKKDNTFEIRLDGENVKSGSLLEDFTPAVNPDKEVDDKDDSKPADWTDEKMIADPKSKKPDDWDEDALFQVIDEKAEKPEDWLEDEPEQIADPEATKPEDWNDEEDGDYIPPMVANPKCESASGCGKWEKPLINNPEYKGKWTAPLIENPDYKGEWAPRKIANPDYFEDKNPSNLEPMGAIGFELWTMNKDILFDNIYIGHDIAEAESVKAKTFDVKHESETKEEDASKPAEEDKKFPGEVNFKEDPIGYLTANLPMFIEVFTNNPMEAIKLMPELAGAIGATLLAALGILIGLLSVAVSGGKPKEAAKVVADKAKAIAKEAEAKVSEATGSDRPEIKKRVTSSKKE